MAVPKKKKSKSRTGMRKNAHSALKKINVILNKDGEYILSHIVSKNGVYNNRKVIIARKRKSDIERDSFAE
jgi:ribosomal protein L32